MNRRGITIMLAGVLLLAAGLILAACGGTIPTTVPPVVSTQVPCPAAVPCPTAAPAKPAVEAPFQKLWAASGHADAKAVAFAYWNTPVAPATVGEIPASCANCHSSTGFQEFAATGKVAKNVVVGTTVDCNACHSEAALKLTSVTFPSGIVIKDLGPEARCMICHEGRASKKQVDDNIAKFKATDMDKLVEPLKNADGTTSNYNYTSAHYFTAALSLYGTQVKGGYEYEGKEYDWKYAHVPGYDTCQTCHNPHSLELEVKECAVCHTEVKTKEDLKNIRMVSSTKDFNGNGNVKEGMAAEVKSLTDTLLKSIYAYAKEIGGVGMVYDGAAYPYFYQDQNGDGKADLNDKNAPVTFTKWTPRLVKAVFNYMVSSKDPGGYAHNGKYIIQLLFDSIEDLNTKLTTKVDMSKMHRTDVGHFAGSGLAFRDWDDTGIVPANCAKCHSAEGLPQFIAGGGTVAVTNTGSLVTTAVSTHKSSNSLSCYTCHNEAKWPAVYSVVNVPFPNGKNLTFSTKKDDKGALLPVGSNICIECHQGRQSTTTVNIALSANTDPDKVDAKMTFKNVHYFSAGATLFGTEAKGVYEYKDKTYLGQFKHVDGFATCTDCHDKHTLEVKVAACVGCHKEAAGGVDKIRMTKESFDGSTDATKPMVKVLETFETRLYAAIQKYAKDKAGAAIIYDAGSYPYFMLDKNADGKADKDDKGANIAYNAFTPRLLRATYNYQYSQKDPGAFAHNAKYVLQALYDSIEDIGGDLTGLVRPTK